MSVREQVQTAAESDSLVIGTKETLKHIDSLAAVVVAANVPQEMYERVREAAEDAGVPIEEFDDNDRELGALCMKPFSASIVGIHS